MPASYFTNQHDYQFFNFINETGADLTVTSVEFPAGFAFDSTTAALWNAGGKRVISYNSVETYGVTTTTGNMFNLRGDTVKVSYTSADGTKIVHNVPISGMRNFQHKMPSVVTVLLAWGNPGAPRPYKLRRQRDTINGFQYFMNTDGTVGMHIQVPTSGSPKWVLIHNDAIIAEYRTFMSVNSNIDTEGAVCSFPADGSYWSSGDNVTGVLPNTQNTPVDRTHLSQYNGWFANATGKSGSLRVIYFQNVNWRVRNGGVTTTPNVKQLKTFVYRADRQYFNTGVNGNSKVGGIDTQRHSFIYELGIVNEVTKHQVMEWEIYDSSTGHFSRFLTQLSSFTVDVTRLGLNPTGVMYARYRILEMGRELTITEHSSSDTPTGTYGRSSLFTGWVPLPTISLSVTPIASSGSDGWIKATPRVFYGEIYSDCGWDTKLTLTTSGAGYFRNHPMVYPDEWVALGINSGQDGSLQTGTFTTNGKLTHNTANHVANTTTVISGSRQDPRVWIRDNNAHWGGAGMASGTYTEGYQCCGKLSGTQYTGRHHDECSPGAAITSATQHFYWGMDCQGFGGHNFSGSQLRSSRNKWQGGADVYYIDDPYPSSNRAGYQGRGESRTSRNLRPFQNAGSLSTQFSSNVRSSYSEFQLTLDIPASWIAADSKIRIEIQNASGNWQPAVHLNGSSTYIHGYWCAWKISELPNAARSGNTWALTSANLPGRTNPTDPESGRSNGTMHTYVHRKNFDDLDSFGSHQGSNIYFAYGRRVSRLKAGGHLGLGYVLADHGTQYCVPLTPVKIVSGGAVSEYKLRIYNVDTGAYSEPFTLTVNETNNVRELAPFCEAFDDDDKDCDD